MAISVAYRLFGSGWSECTIFIGDSHATVTASYLDDALGDFLRALSTILGGASESRASFVEEPGEYRWIFTRVAPDQLRVQILWFDELWNDMPDDRGKPVFDATCRLRTFAGAVLAASQRVLEEFGIDGYRDKWIKHEFPLAEQAELERLLDQPDI